VPPRSYAHKRACIGLITEVDACLADEYNAHQAAKEYPRMLFNANLANTYNCVTFYLFKPEQIRCIHDVWMRRMPADRDRVWIRLPAKLKLKKFTWEEGILCFLYRLVNIQTFAGMVHIFGLKESDLCALFGFMLEDFMQIFGHLLQDLSLYAPYLEDCARCSKIPYENCPFFLDGTFRWVLLNNPSRSQRQVLNTGVE
jgi:hypothetical protein